MFEKLKIDFAAGRLVEEQLYEHVVKELRQGILRNGLWAKALANSDGNEEKVKALYIKYRIQSIKDEITISAASQNEVQTVSIDNSLCDDHLLSVLKDLLMRWDQLEHTARVRIGTIFLQKLGVNDPVPIPNKEKELHMLLQQIYRNNT